jgi:ketosteroid isomerase-like protein
MTRAVVCLGTLVCLVFSAGCRTKQSPTRLSDADRELIRQADVAFTRNAQAEPRDDRASAGFYEDSAIMLAPNQTPIRGRAGIEAYLASFPPFSDYRLDVAEIEGEGGLAYERGTASLTLTPSGGAPGELRINYLVIWRKQVDGSWKVAREIFTPDAAASAATRPQ